MERLNSGKPGSERVAFRLGRLTDEEAMGKNRFGLCLTSPPVTHLASFLLTSGFDEPPTRREIEEATDLPANAIGKSIGLLSSVGAVVEGSRIVPTERGTTLAVLTVEPTDRLAKLAARLPAWQEAVELRLAEREA